MVTHQPLGILHVHSVVAALPVPEKGHDLAHVRASGNIFQALVVDADRRRPFVGLSVGVGDLDRQRGLLAWLEL